MLNTEFGGMNEVLADLYADTGDARWLALSYRFEHRAVLDPLKRHQDILAGKHGNTQVPKLHGLAGALRLHRRRRRRLRRRLLLGPRGRSTTATPPAATARTSTSASPTS